VETDYTSLFGGEVLEQRGDALIEAWRSLLAPVITQHLLGTIAVDVNGAAATARCHVRGVGTKQLRGMVPRPILESLTWEGPYCEMPTSIDDSVLLPDVEAESYFKVTPNDTRKKS